MQAIKLTFTFKSEKVIIKADFAVKIPVSLISTD